MDSVVNVLVPLRHLSLSLRADALGSEHLSQRHLALIALNPLDPDLPLLTLLLLHLFEVHLLNIALPSFLPPLEITHEFHC
jgi:hypothetical protein